MANNGTGTGVLTLTGVVSGASGSLTKTGAENSCSTARTPILAAQPSMAVCWRPAVPAFLGQLPSFWRRVSPGVNVGSATTGSATWNSGGKYDFEIDSATGSTGSAWDLWSITGGVSASGTFTISAITESSNGVLGQMVNFNNANTYQWLLASSSTAMPSNLLSFLALDGSGFQNALAGTGHIFLSESADT